MPSKPPKANANQTHILINTNLRSKFRFLPQTKTTDLECLYWHSQPQQRTIPLYINEYKVFILVQTSAKNHRTNLTPDDNYKINN